MSTAQPLPCSEHAGAFATRPAFRVARLLVAETYDLAREPADQIDQVDQVVTESARAASCVDHASILRRRALAVPNELVRHARHARRADQALGEAVDRLLQEIERAHDDGYLGGRRYRRLQQLGSELERSTRS